MGKPRTDTVERFFAAMQAGATAEAAMMTLFAESATYVEPFSGKVRTHVGKDAIVRAMRDGWKEPLPEMRIEVEAVSVDGNVVTAKWTCHSPAIPGGKGHGENVFTLDEEGRILRLETRFR
jgi:ketosteroid isomerase-like protein